MYININANNIANKAMIILNEYKFEALGNISVVGSAIRNRKVGLIPVY